MRPLVWLFHLALPMAGLWLLVAHPMLDIDQYFPAAHFVVVSLGALLSAVLGYLINEAARRRSDTRLFLVGLAFLTSAGFLCIHAVATPHMLVMTDTVGFELGVPIGLTIAAFFAAVSGLNLRPRTAAALLGRATLIRAVLIGVLVAWAIAAVVHPMLLSGPTIVPLAVRLRPILAAVGGLLYAVAVIRYFLEYRRRRGVVLLSTMTAFLLLAEALFSVPVAPMWHLAWWMWHLLMAIAFGYVAYSAHIQYQFEGDSAGLFDGVGTQSTVQRLRGEYGAALEALVGVLSRPASADGPGHDQEILAASQVLGSQFGLSDSQTVILRRAAQALASERAQLSQLGALAGIGREASVIRTEADLLKASLRQIADGFPHHRVRIGLLVDGQPSFPAELCTDPASTVDEAERDAADQALAQRSAVEDNAGGMVLPLLVKGQPCGVLQIRREWGQLDERDNALLESLAAQLSIALENTRLYGQLDGLFRSYISPDVVTELLADPSRAELGGALLEVSALFADLQGFTTYSEQITPHELVELLNRYFAAATRAVLDEGGTVVHFAGDAILALFNAPTRQSDHAERAARAALALQVATEELAKVELDAPRFRVGVNTGAALVGNIGSEQLRSFSAIGDAINVAARLQTSAEPGTVVISRSTLGRLSGSPRTSPLGALTLKGRSGAVQAFVLHNLGDAEPWDPED